jgi:hypothetical protein
MEKEGKLNKCPECGSKIKIQGDSLHAWNIDYKCGFSIIGLIDVDGYEVRRECYTKEAKEEAERLYDSFYPLLEDGRDISTFTKKASTICVNRILKLENISDDDIKFWKMVKKEIKKL